GTIFVADFHGRFLGAGGRKVSGDGEDREECAQQRLSGRQKKRFHRTPGRGLSDSMRESTSLLQRSSQMNEAPRASAAAPHSPWLRQGVAPHAATPTGMASDPLAEPGAIAKWQLVARAWRRGRS